MSDQKTDSTLAAELRARLYNEFNLNQNPLFHGDSNSAEGWGSLRSRRRYAEEHLKWLLHKPGENMNRDHWLCVYACAVHCNAMEYPEQVLDPSWVWPGETEPDDNSDLRAELVEAFGLDRSLPWKQTRLENGTELARWQSIVGWLKKSLYKDRDSSLRVLERRLGDSSLYMVRDWHPINSLAVYLHSWGIEPDRLLDGLGEED